MNGGGFPQIGPRSRERIRAFLSLVIILSAAAFSFPTKNPPTPLHTETPGAIPSVVSELAPGGLRVTPASHGACLFEGRNGEGKLLWHALFSDRLSSQPTGYAGPIRIVVGADDSGKVTGLKVLSHVETPTFVQGIDQSWFLDQFRGKSVSDPLRQGEDIDGLTHATVSVDAIGNTVRACLATLEAPVQAGTPAPVSVPHSLPRPFPTDLLFLAMALVTLLFRKRIPFLLESGLMVLFLGVISRQFLSLAHLQMLVRIRFSPVSAGIPLIGFAAAAAILVFFLRRGYCVFLCPMGRLQDLLRTLGARLFRGWTAAKDVGQVPEGAGRTLLWACIVATIFVPRFPGERLEAFSALFIRNMGAFGFLLVVPALLGSLIAGRFYCRALCPLNPLFADIEALKPKPGGARSDGSPPVHP